ncbi:MAG: 2-oxoacid:acceptor oxidoreductase subunit alpha [Bacteroidales bacterium]
MGVTERKKVEKITIRFSGDSGDGMQLTGTLFSETSALFGNNISTFPDYPSEIRAPQGTISGVSGFQVHIGETNILTPGDLADVLVAMNPAALKANIKWVKQGGTIIVDVDAFEDKWLQKAGYSSNPLTDGSLKEKYTLILAPITQQTFDILKDSGIDNKSIDKMKNMFALGLTYWLFNRPLHHTEKFLDKHFSKKPEIAQANKLVLKYGYQFGETLEALTPVHIPPANIEKGKYRNISGNVASAWGLIAAAEKAGLKLFLGSYPITPASEILQELTKRQDLGVKVLQCEDEIAAICSAIGASYSGLLGATSTSGPGLSLKSEALGLAIMLEIPLVVINVQRGGPSTGLPTKTEQADLLQSLFGRHGESPLIVLAASTPSDCFNYSFLAAKLSLEHMTPVILLTDGYLANGSQPWKIPQISELPDIKTRLTTQPEGKHTAFIRDEKTLARKWVIPGVKDMLYRIGGLEKDYVTGNPSQDPANHEKMVRTRAEKVKRLGTIVPKLTVFGDSKGELLIIGWGSTYGHLHNVTQKLINQGKKVAHVHFNYIKPLPPNVKEILSNYNKIIVCELNLGQFAMYLKMNFGEFDFLQFNKIQGLPFTEDEIYNECLKYI